MEKFSNDITFTPISIQVHNLIFLSYSLENSEYLGRFRKQLKRFSFEIYSTPDSTTWFECFNSAMILLNLYIVKNPVSEYQVLLKEADQLENEVRNILDQMMNPLSANELTKLEEIVKAPCLQYKPS